MRVFCYHTVVRSEDNSGGGGKPPIKQLLRNFVTLTSLSALVEVITRAIHYSGRNLEPVIGFQTANEIIPKGEHRCQHAATHSERLRFVQEQREGRLAYQDGSEQRTWVPTGFDDRFGVSRRLLVRHRHVHILQATVLERAGTSVRTSAPRSAKKISAAYLSAGPEPGCVTRRLNTHRNCENKHAMRSWLEYGHGRSGGGPIKNETQRTRTGAINMSVATVVMIPALNKNALMTPRVGINSVYVNAGP